MSARIDSLVESSLDLWQNATLTDYSHAVLAIVLLAWLFNRLTERTS